MSVTRILIIGPAWIGDMMMAQSLFKLLKTRDPSVAIDVLAPPWTFPVLAYMKEVERTLPLDIHHGELGLKKRHTLARDLKKNNYTQAIVLPNSFKSALIPWFARIPKRTGYNRECRTILLNDSRELDKQKYPLMVEQYLALGISKDQPLPAYAYPQIEVTETQQQHALTALHLVVAKNPILALCPGAEFGPSKRWPSEYYADIATQKLKQGWDVWLFGSAKDRPITDEIMVKTAHQCKNIAGLTTLTDAIALLSLATGVITNDSGLMHVAAALNKPLIALFGSTSPTFTPPLSKQAKVVTNLKPLPCQPCFKRDCPLSHHDCMRQLTPSLLLETMKSWEVT